MPFVNFEVADLKTDRKLRQMIKKNRKSENRSRNLSGAEKIREGAELLALARSGDLFDVNIDNVYDLSANDIKKYTHAVTSKQIKCI